MLLFTKTQLPQECFCRYAFLKPFSLQDPPSHPKGLKGGSPGERSGGAKGLRQNRREYRDVTIWALLTSHVGAKDAQFTYPVVSAKLFLMVPEDPHNVFKGFRPHRILHLYHYNTPAPGTPETTLGCSSLARGGEMPKAIKACLDGWNGSLRNSHFKATKQICHLPARDKTSELPQ